MTGRTTDGSFSLPLIPFLRNFFLTRLFPIFRLSFDVKFKLDNPSSVLQAEVLFFVPGLLLS